MFDHQSIDRRASRWNSRPMLAPLLFVALAAPLAPQDGVRLADPPTADGDRRAEERPDRGTLDGMPDARGQAGPDREAPPGARAETRLAPPNPGDYVLGVYAYNTREGVTVTGVVPGSPAAAVGLERGDRVLTVDGYQVGYVKQRAYPLGREIRLRSGRRGEVTLLVQNVRNQQLVNLDVRIGRDRPGLPRPPRPYESRDAAPDVLRDDDTPRDRERTGDGERSRSRDRSRER